jgi:hypothetical protein
VSFSRVKMAAVALGGLFLAAAGASADTVRFKTEFDFNPSAAGIQSTLSLADGASLTLNGLSNTTAVPGADAGFGSITFDPKDSRGTLAIDRDFVLTVTLLDPTSGWGSTTANFFGSINTRSTTGSITLTGGSVAINGYHFTLLDTDVSLLKGVVESQALLGTITAPTPAQAVPVPAALYGGASLLGLLGGARIRRCGQAE